MPLTACPLVRLLCLLQQDETRQSDKRQELPPLGSPDHHRRGSATDWARGTREKASAVKRREPTAKRDATSRRMRCARFLAIPWAYFLFFFVKKGAVIEVSLRGSRCPPFLLTREERLAKRGKEVAPFSPTEQRRSTRQLPTRCSGNSKPGDRHVCSRLQL